MATKGIDVETARFLERWLEREHPGTVWDVELEPARSESNEDQGGEPPDGA